MIFLGIVHGDKYRGGSGRKQAAGNQKKEKNYFFHTIDITSKTMLKNLHSKYKENLEDKKEKTSPIKKIEEVLTLSQGFILYILLIINFPVTLLPAEITL